MASELEPCPFCSKTMMLRSALWPSEGDADAIIHADPTDCPMLGFSDGSADGSIIEKWNCSLSNEDDFPSDGSCVRCGSVPRNANGLCNTCLDEDAERLENTRPAPAATDTGLETVEYQFKPGGNDYWTNTTARNFPGYKVKGWQTRELVDRSQVEVLIAHLQKELSCRDALIKDHLGKILHLENRVDEEALRADQADELLAGRDVVIETQANSIDKLERKVQHWQNKHDALEAKLAAAEKALEEADEALQADAIASAHAAIRAVLGGKP